MPFSSTLGFYGFLALIPFILIYLFKPKPIDKRIPSLMFFMRDQKQKKQFSFLRRLLTNLVFLLQLLAILALALSLAGPFTFITKDAESGNTVIVIDSSASMQAKTNGKTRFDLALVEARKRMHGRVSIILASLYPEIVLENSLKTDASRYLQTLKPKESSTNIKGSMDIADTILEKEKGEVIVLSDFITTIDNDDPIIAKRFLNAKGNSVSFVNFAGIAENVGFVDLNIQKDSTDAYIKNFNDIEKTVTVSLIKDKKVIKSYSIKLNAKSKEKVVFETLPGLSTLTLSPSDDLDADNIVYISSPLKDKIKVLLIANTIPKSLKNALQAASSIEVVIAEPPIIPDIDHDVVILSNILKEELLPGTFNDIKRYVEKGGNLIINAQDGISEIDMLGLLPVKIIGMGEKSQIITVRPNEFTKDIDFGIAKRYIITNLTKDSISFIDSEDSSSMLAFKTQKKGKVFYYGLFDSENDFKFSPDYPIFWNNLIEFMIDTEDINDYNFKIGEKSLIEKAGFIKENDKQIAYNFLNELESDISKEPSLFENTDANFVAKDVKEEKRLDFTVPLLILVSFILFSELVYIKYRGDL